MSARPVPSASSRQAGIYCRISQDRADKREGVKRQEADCRALAAELGWDVAAIYVDNDVSASSGRPRPEWSRMLADVESGAVDAVLAWHPDRLIRRPVELEGFIDLVETTRTAVSTVKAGDYDLSTASGKMVARMLGAAARHETDRMSERIKATKAQKRTEGLWKGGSRPFGHRPVPNKPGYLQIDEDEAEVLRGMVDAFLAGASLRSIAHDLNVRSVPRTRGDVAWTTGDVARVISRPVAAGLVVHQGEVVAKAVGWEAIVPEDKWRAVRAVLDDPSRRTVKPGRRERHLLSGFALCGGPLDAGGECGATIMGNAGIYYRCSAGRNGRLREPGSHVYRQRPELDAYVRELVIARLSRPDAASLLVPVPVSEEDPDALGSQADALRKRLSDLAEMFAEGVMTRGQVSTASAKIKADLEDVEGRLAVAANVTPAKIVPELGSPDPADAEDRDQREARAAEVWDALPRERQREVLRALMTVTVLPSNRRGNNPFRTSDVRVDWLA